MDDDEDDMYAPAGTESKSSKPHQNTSEKAELARGEDQEEEAAEGAENDEDDESDSDIDIITESKGAPKLETPVQARGTNAIKSPAVQPATPASGAGIKPQQNSSTKADATAKSTPPTKSGSSYPAVKSSTIDLNAIPTHEATGKPITEVDMDADFAEGEKPWRRPGSDMTDYFNYGFDEFTWAGYCLKQDAMRKEAANQKKSVEEMQNFLGGPSAGMGMPSVPAVGLPAMPGMADAPPDMQQTMQQMMMQGMDPSQMDFGGFMQMMQGGGQQAMGGAGFGQQGQQQSQMGFGYGGGGSGGGGGGGQQGGHNAGRGRGHRGRW